jgi:UDP:flavonoid glycosyltransferase YjiC (YdhE family)
MRIALAVEGTRGDVHPMLALGTSLAERGHDVLVCAPPDFAEETEARGLGFRAVGAPVRPYLERRAAALLRGPWSALREAERYLEESLPAQFAALPAAVEGANLIVAAGLQFAAGSLAELWRIPYRYVAYCPALFPSAEHPPFVLPPQRFPRGVNRMLWHVFLAFQERQIRPRMDAARARLGLPRLESAFRHLVGERPILAADADLAPRPADASVPIVQVPCLHPAAPAQAALPPKLEAFLDQGSAPVYLGFGSMPDPDSAATTARVLRAVERLGCRALLSAGWAGLGAEGLPEGVLAIGAMDHMALFPRVAAVVHHGGAGTTTTAARAGVPQVVVPHVLDQFYWGERVRVLGLGPPPLPRRRLEVGTLAATLAEVIGNEIVAERAADLGARLRARASHEPALAELLGAGAA